MFRNIGKRQRLELDYYFTPDGERFDLHNGADTFLISMAGTGMPPITYIQTRGPYQHGVNIIDYRLDPRAIQAVFRQNAGFRQDYWDVRANLLDILRPNRQVAGQLRLGKLRKIIPGGKIRDIDVFIQQGPVFNARTTDVWDDLAITEALLFIAPDPTFYDPTQVCYVWSIDPASNLIFPFTFPFTLADSTVSSSQNVVYTGTWLSFPSIEIAGPLETPQIRNDTTGDYIRLDYTIAEGETVTIGLAFGNKTVTSTLRGNIIGLASGDIATFHIAPHPEATNGLNVITVTGGNALLGTTTVTLSFYTRYIGI